MQVNPRPLPTFGLDQPRRDGEHPVPADTIPRPQKQFLFTLPEVDDRKLLAITIIVNPDSGEVHGTSCVSLGQTPSKDQMLTMVMGMLRKRHADVFRFFWW